MTTGSAIRHFTLDLDDLEWTGNDLVRPESVVAEPDGTLWASDARGGATRIDPGGGQSFLGGWGGEPNGLAIDPSGDLVTANIALGLVQRMTREDQWWPAVAHPRPDGFIVLVDERGARIVADGIYGTNEARLASAPAPSSTGSPSTPRATCGSPRWSATASACWTARATGTWSSRTRARTCWRPSRTSSGPAPASPRTCWPPPARRSSSRPACASRARTCGPSTWDRWPCRGCPPSARQFAACR